MSEDFRIELRVAEALAREAGRRMVDAARAGFEIETKARDEVVTEVDRAIERFVVGELRALYPDDRIHGEEFGVELGVESGASRSWLVDPIDGTLNFSRGIPVYCVSIALQVDGRSVVGAVYDPNRDELFSARRGAGARLDGAALEISACREMSDAVLVTGFPLLDNEAIEDDNLDNFAAMMRTCRTVRRLGSAALDLAYVAAGRFVGFWEFELSPWDTAAGYLLVEEAGGRVTSVGGAPYTGHEPSVLATNAHLHDEIAEVLTAIDTSEESS